MGLLHGMEEDQEAVDSHLAGTGSCCALEADLGEAHTTWTKYLMLHTKVEGWKLNWSFPLGVGFDSMKC